MKCQVVNSNTSPFDVYVGRPSKWGNPFIIGKDGNRKEVVEQYKKWIKTQPDLLNSLHELDGKILGCHCWPKDCHGNVLADLVEELNQPEIF